MTANNPKSGDKKDVLSAVVKPIPSAPGYCATSGGHIIGKKGFVLAEKSNNWGYKQIGTWLNGKAKLFSVHRLVLEAFAGPCPPGKECARHLDGNPNNNQISNLVWGTLRENQTDRKSHGTANYVSTHPKLTTLQVIEIRELKRKSDLTNARIAKMYGVGETTIWSILHRRIWRQV